MASKVLIVDDEPDVLSSTALVVEHLGYTSLTVSDPAQILDMVEKEHPDVILQDLRMPGLNVSGLVAALRTNPATADIPLVFFSANEDLATTAARYDAWGHLAKPFSAQELGHLLRQVLGPRHMTDVPDLAAVRSIQREVRSAFHDYWNLLAAQANYLSVLKANPVSKEQAEKALLGLDETLLKLESLTDRLRSFMLALPVGIAPAASPSAPDGASARKSPS